VIDNDVLQRNFMDALYREINYPENKKKILAVIENMEVRQKIVLEKLIRSYPNEARNMLSNLDGGHK